MFLQMYGDAFGLRCPPFEDRVDTQFFYRTPELEETLAVLDEAARRHKGTVFVVGEAGTGKTLLLQNFVSGLQPSDHAVVITCSTGTRTHLLRETCKGYRVGLKPREDHAHRLDRLRRYLTRTRDAGQHCVLIVDQVEHLAPGNLSELSALCDLQDHRGKLLSILLFGQPRFKSTLRDSPYGGLQQRLLAERTLLPLPLAQTGEYVRHRLKVAGATNDELFDGSAIAAIHNATNGLPRLINRACNGALLAAAKSGDRQVLGPFVENVIHAGPRPASVPAASTLNPSVAVNLPVTVVTPTSEFIDSDQVVALEHDSQTPSQVDWQRPIDSLLNAGQSLLDRLEQALARADRMTAVADAAVTEFKRVETGADGLMQGTGRFADRLSRLTEEAVESIEVVERKLQGMLGEAEKRIESATERMREAGRDAERRMEALERGRERAERVDSRSATVLEQLGRATEQAQQRWTELSRTVEDAAGTRRTLESAVERGDTLAREAEQSLESQHRKLQDMVGDCTRAGEALHAQTQASQVKSQQSVAAQERVQERTQRLESRITDLLRQVTTGYSELDRRIAQWTRSQESAEQAEAKLQVVLQQVSSAVCEGDQRVVRYGKESEQIEVRLGDATRAAEKVQSTSADFLERGARQINELAETQVRFERLRDELVRGVQEAAARADEERRELVRAVEEASKGREIADLLHSRNREARELSDRVQTQHLTLGSLQGELQRIAEIAQEAGKKAAENGADAVTNSEEAVRSVKEVARGVEEAGVCLSSQWTAIMIEAELQAQNLSLAVNEALNTCNRVVQELREEQAKSEVTLSESARATGDLVAEGTTAARHAHEAQQVSETLKAQQSQLQAISEGLNDLVPIAEASKLELGNAVNGSTESAKQLLAHQAESKELLGKLAEAETTVHTVIEKLRCVSGRSQKDAQEAVDQVRTVIESVREQTQSALEAGLRATSGRTEADLAAQQVREAIRQAEDGRKAIDVATGVAAERLAQLDARGTAAEDLLIRLADAHTGVQTVMEQSSTFLAEMSDLARSVASAKETESAIREVADEARLLYDAVKGITSTTSEHAARMEDLNTQASERIQQHEHIKRAAEAAFAHATEQLAAQRAWTQTAETLLSEFVQRGEQIGERLGGLQGQVTQIEQSLADLTSAPSRIVADAQTQAARLNNVCTSVRKVFAHLANTTLDARKQSQAFERAGATAQERLSRLAEETQAASGTLREWVEEAIRTQARLERTLKQCPPIERTHSAEPLRKLSRPATAVSAPQQVATADIGSVHSLESPGTIGVTADRVAKPVPDSDEISRMIEEAKQAHLASKG